MRCYWLCLWIRRHGGLRIPIYKQDWPDNSFLFSMWDGFTITKAMLISSLSSQNSGVWRKCFWVCQATFSGNDHISWDAFPITFTKATQSNPKQHVTKPVTNISRLEFKHLMDMMKTHNIHSSISITTLSTAVTSYSL